MHKRDFAHLTSQIDHARQELNDTQNGLKLNPIDGHLTSLEKTHYLALQKLLAIEESALRQKSRILWLQQGDANTHVFFQAMKERYNQDSIDVLYDA